MSYPLSSSLKIASTYIGWQKDLEGPKSPKTDDCYDDRLLFWQIYVSIFVL